MNSIIVAACIEKQSDIQVAEFTSVLRNYVLKETKAKNKQKITQQNKIKKYMLLALLSLIKIHTQRQQQQQQQH